MDETLANELTVMQWNVWYRAKPIDVAGHIIHLAEKYGLPDVFCLQEVRKDALEVIADAVLARDVTFVQTREHRNGIIEGQAIISRIPFVEPYSGADITVLSHGGRTPFKGGAKSTRILQKVGIATPSGQQVTVANTHMSYATPFNRSLRQNELEALCEAVEKEEALILVGDFNAGPNSHAVSHIGGILVRANTGEPTWTSSHVDKVGLLRRQLDHVYTTSDISVVSIQVLEKGFSDHTPILTRARTT